MNYQGTMAFIPLAYMGYIGYMGCMGAWGAWVHGCMGCMGAWGTWMLVVQDSAGCMDTKHSSLLYSLLAKIGIICSFVNPCVL